MYSNLEVTTASDNNGALSVETAALLQYHISENHLPTGAEVVRKELLLLTLGLGGLNYVPVAYQNGSTVPVKIINAVTTAILGEILLYLSGRIYWDIKIEPQYIAQELENIIQAPLTKEAFFYEVLTQIGFAAASAIPLATTLFDANWEIFEEYPWFFWVALAFIEIVNTAMHLVPIELTMRDEFYGFLPRQLTSVWTKLMGYRPSVEESASIALFDGRAKILTEINPILLNAKENFIRDLANQSEKDIQSRLSAYKISPKQLFADMLACYVATPPLNPIARAMARVSGGLLVSGACLGYAANPYLVFKNKFHFSIGWAIGLTAVPIYFFMVLMTFFGDGMGVRALQDALSLLQPSTVQKKLPTVAKLYPLIFTMAAAAILFIAAFAGAPGREMMKMAYEGIFSEEFMAFMQAVVTVGIGLLAIYAPLDFTKIILNHYARYVGAEPVKSIAILKAKIEALLLDFNRIKPEFAAALKLEIQSRLPSHDAPEALGLSRQVESGLGYRCCCFPKQSNENADASEKLLPSAGH